MPGCATAPPRAPPETGHPAGRGYCAPSGAAGRMGPAQCPCLLRQREFPGRLRNGRFFESLPAMGALPEPFGERFDAAPAAACHRDDVPRLPRLPPRPPLRCARERLMCQCSCPSARSAASTAAAAQAQPQQHERSTPRFRVLPLGGDMRLARIAAASRSTAIAQREEECRRWPLTAT